MRNYGGLTASELQTEHGVLQDLIEEVGAEVDNPFVLSVIEQYEKNGNLSEAQIEGLLKFYENIG